MIGFPWNLAIVYTSFNRVTSTHLDDLVLVIPTGNCDRYRRMRSLQLYLCKPRSAKDESVNTDLENGNEMFFKDQKCKKHRKYKKIIVL